MTGILPEGENVRRALRWIAEERRVRPGVPLAKVLDEAMLRFDLTPLQCERLVEAYRAAREQGEA